MTGIGYCFRHNPEAREAAIAASGRGGRNREQRAAFGSRTSLKTPADVTTLLEEVINAVWTGEAPAKVGTSIGFLARCWLDAHDAATIAPRLAEFDRRLTEAGI